MSISFTRIRNSICLILLASLWIFHPAQAARAPGVECELQPSLGGAEGKVLTNRIPGDQVLWRSGENEPASVAVIAKLPQKTKIDHVTLISTSPNWWCWVPHVKLYAREDADGEWRHVSDHDWYVRKPDSDEPQHTRQYVLNIPLGNTSISEVKVELHRPNGWVIMPLSEIELHAANAVEADVLPDWQACHTGQTLKGKIRFVNDSKETAKGFSAKLNVLRGESVEAVCWEKTFDLPPGTKEFPFTYQPSTPGKVVLQPMVSSDRRGIPVYSFSSEPIEIVPPTSKYWFPIGTCCDGPTAPYYGFTVKHNWYYPPEETSWTTGPDQYASSLESGMIESECHTAGFDFTVPENQTHLVRANGEPLIGGFSPVSHHLPSYQLEKQLAGRLEFWNGHPGLYQYVYNNEQCYANWITQGLVDYNPHAISAFQKYLADTHSSIAKLNALYRTKYKDFSEIQPPRNYQGPSPDWFDWMQFRRQGLANHMVRSYKLIKPHFSQGNLTFKGIQIGDFFVASTAIDPWLWRDGGDVYGFDLYPWCRDGYMEAAFGLDFHRTQVDGKPIQFLESNIGYWRPGVMPRDAMDFNRNYWPAFLRGLRGCYWFQWYSPWNKGERRYWLSDEDGSLFETGEEATRMAKQVQTLAPVLNFARPLGVEVAMYYPWEEIDQTPNIAPMNALRGAYKILTQLHYPVDIISYHNIRNGELPRYKVLVLAGARHLYPDVARSIDEFVKNGGVLIADRQAGYYDQYHRKTQSLLRTFGAKHIAENDTFSRMNLTKTRSIDLPKIRTDPSPMGDNGPACAPQARAEVIRRIENTKVLATFPKDQILKNVVDHVLAQAPTYQASKSDNSESESPPDGLPAAVARSYGKGKTLYIAAAVFNAYRNYFYTLSQAPYPVCRDNELLNQGDPNIRKLIGDFLVANNIVPPVDVDVRNEDPEVDDMHFQILSYYGNDDCALVGVTNWGPRRRHNVPVKVNVSFDTVQKVYCLDTVRERLLELPFTLDPHVAKTTIPLLDGTVILIIVGKSGPLLVQAEQQAPDSPVTATLINHLSENATGYVQLRVDGIAEPLSDKVPFRLDSGKTTKIALPVREVDPTVLVDPRGLPRPWYVWVIHDGNARAFGRVQPAGTRRAP